MHKVVGKMLFFFTTNSIFPVPLIFFNSFFRTPQFLLIFDL